jgi:threonine dehydrogenase-like Zn-dependent dehydrogenase
VGLLAALFGVQRGLDVHVLDHATDGPKPALVRDLGATYHVGPLNALRRDFDIVIECTGAESIVVDVVSHTAPDGIICLLGVSDPGKPTTIDMGALNNDIVIGNRVLFGSVNANHRHYEAAMRALGRANPDWLRRLITRRVPLASWHEAFEKRPHDVKTVIDFASE